MKYFETHYNVVRLPLAENGTPGLRLAQLGAIHSVAGHFTLSSADALVVMPTGSGKTAVQMVTAYLLRAKRVLVITPNRLVRRQVAEEFKNLLTLKRATVFGLEVPTPNVFEVEEKITTGGQWQALSTFDVIVGTPNSISPAIDGVAAPPENFFDLVLVDEAHHSPAKIWNALLAALPHARVVKFTATPFRRDWREIKGKPVYVYPVSRAYEDKIFGRIEYYPVEEGAEAENDIRIAVAAENAFKEDRAQRFDHLLMVRTDSKKRARELKKIYQQHTGLRLELVTSDYSYGRIKKIIERLRAFLVRGAVPHALPLNRINKVLIGLENFDFFNIGMRNRMMKSNTESYRTLAGSRAQKAVNPSDGRLYNRGHIFGRAREGEKAVTIGYSSLSKVWSNNNTRIPELIRWCRNLAERIVSEQEVLTHSGLDWLSVGETVTTIPRGVIGAEWDLDAFKNPLTVSYRKADGLEVKRQLLDLDLEVDQQHSDQSRIRVRLVGEDLIWEADFSLKTNSYFRFVATTATGDVTVHRGNGSMSLIDYFNGRPLSFYFADFSRLQQNNLFKSAAGEQEVFDASSQILPIDWEGSGVDITVEVGQCANGKVSIQDHMKRELVNTGAQIVYYDHGSGEIADFVTFTMLERELLIQLYHCKGAGGQQAGKRAEDLYEVCSQVIKSLIWIHDNESLRQKIERRCRTHQGSEFLKGDKELLKEFTLRARTLQTRYEIVIVQPGVSQSSLPEKMSHLLAAANDYIIRGQCSPLIVWASA